VKYSDEGFFVREASRATSHSKSYSELVDLFSELGDVIECLQTENVVERLKLKLKLHLSLSCEAAKELLRLCGLDYSREAALFFICLQGYDLGAIFFGRFPELCLDQAEEGFTASTRRRTLYLSLSEASRLPRITPRRGSNCILLTTNFRVFTFRKLSATLCPARRPFAALSASQMCKETVRRGSIWDAIRYLNRNTGD
jgi:hypothetical protein